jgi:hypothetical protein
MQNIDPLAEEGADIVGIDLLEHEPCAPYPMAAQNDMDETIALVEKTGRRDVQAFSPRPRRADDRGRRTRFHDDDADGQTMGGAERHFQRGAVPGQRRIALRHRHRTARRHGHAEPALTVSSVLAMSAHLRKHL